MSAAPTVGCWIDGGEVLEGRELAGSVDPATGRVWAYAAQARPEDVDAAVVAARRAFREGPWRSLTASERGDLLLALADRIDGAADELAELESHDNGKPIWHTRGEVAATARWYRYYAGAADKLEGASIDVSTTRQGWTSHRPLGVVAVLSPFNGPFSLTSWKVAPALATGNTVVVKPSPDTPMTPLRLAQLAGEAGFPPGVLNVVCGDGDLGAALVGHADVAAVAFTGSTEVGRRIAAAAGGELKRVLIEAGGKSPFVVFDDADLDAAIPAAVAGIFGGTGQSCVASSRFIVQRTIHEAFVARLEERMHALRVGDPFDPRTHIGPLASARQLERVGGYVELARREGRQVLQAELPARVAASGGFYHPPTLVVGGESAMRLAQEEIFGPVGVVLAFDDEEEAVRIANDTQFGLAAGVWSNDARRAHRVARRLEAGTVWINTYRAMHWSLPFGGCKQSGFGRENGLEALREFTQLQTQVVDYGPPAPDPYAP